ncbi:MAG: helix-turn-helix domain-containing protein [Lachnospiraceae bacterium]|nr:helix-turn-helix domain-containing protein [Lachnospiraceae bacterium]
MRIKEICKEKNISVEHLAGILNISRQAVYRWINEKTLPTTDHLVELADILDVALDDIVVRKEY